MHNSWLTKDKLEIWGKCAFFVSAIEQSKNSSTFIKLLGAIKSTGLEGNGINVHKTNTSLICVFWYVTLNKL